MPRRRTPAAILVRASVTVGAALLFASLGGCAVVSVASTAVGLAVTGAGLVVDAAVGTAKAVGSAASAVLPGEQSK